MSAPGVHGILLSMFCGQRAQRNDASGTTFDLQKNPVEIQAMAETHRGEGSTPRVGGAGAPGKCQEKPNHYQNYFGLALACCTQTRQQGALRRWKASS